MKAGLKLGDATYQSFEPLVGTELTLRAPERDGVPLAAYRFTVEEVAVNSRVAEASKAGQPGSIYQRIPFSVLLRALDEPPFVQALLGLEHPDFEDCDIMITRIAMPGRDPQAAWFEAVFG
jgi:hypothetical protein